VPQTHVPAAVRPAVQAAYQLWVSEDFEAEFLELEQRLSGCIVDLSAALHVKT
jgi:hypothetical protein